MTNPSQQTFRLSLLTVSVSVALTACGGGGGGSGTGYDNPPNYTGNPTTPPATPAPPTTTPAPPTTTPAPPIITPKPPTTTPPAPPIPPKNPPPTSGNTGITRHLDVVKDGDSSKNDSKQKAPPANLHINDYTNDGKDAFYHLETHAHLNVINQKTAIDQGLTGKGVTIGVVDGPLSSRYESDPAVTQYMRYTNTNRGVVAKKETITPYIDGEILHANSVIITAAGRVMDKRGRGGVAPDTKIIAATPDEFDGAAAAKAWQDMSKAGVKVINNSWGENNMEDAFHNFNLEKDEYKLAANKRATLIGQTKEVVDRGTLLVFAAGNSAEKQPSSMSLSPLIEPSLQKGIIAVVGTENTGQIAYDKGNIATGEEDSGSTHCGLAAQWCMAAPYRVNVLLKGMRYNNAQGVSIYEGDTLEWNTEGTSFAAPMVSGAAALLLQKFPWMDNANLSTTLLTTAQDLGAKGVDSVYGWGLLNIGKAINGPAQFAFGDFHANVTGGTQNHYTFSNDISGAGGLVKRGNAKLTLSGKNSYTGQTHVAEGTLGVTGSLKSSTIVHDKATLDLGKGATVGTVNNYGTLSYNTGDANIHGDLNQSQTGTLHTKLGNVLNVTGKASVAGKLSMDTPGTYARTDGTQVNFLKANQGVSGQFNTVETTGALMGGTSQVSSPDNKTLAFVVKRKNVNATSQTLSTESAFKQAVTQSAANVENIMIELDNQPDDTLVGSKLAHAAAALQTQSAGTLAKSLNTLSAATYANSTSVYAMEQGKQATTLADNMDGSLKSGEAKALVHYTRTDSKWEKNGAQGQVNANHITLGGNTRLTDTWSLSAALTGGQTRWHENIGGSAKADSKGLMFGARYDLPHNSYLKGVMGLHHYDMTVNRDLSIALGMPANVRAKLDGRLYQLAFLAGKTWGFDNHRWLLNTEAGVRYDYLKQDGFSEQGNHSGLAWKGNKVSEGTPVGIFALKTSYQITPAIGLFGQVGIEHDFKARDYTVSGQFVGASRATGTTGAWTLPRIRGMAGLGLNVQLGKSWSLTGQYQLTGSNQYQDHSAKIGLAYTF